MAKKTRCFSYGGSATDIAGNLASPGLYDNDRGMSIGLSGAKHIASTDANNATPAAPMQQYVGMKVTNSPSSQSRRDASPLARLDQDIAMGNAMGELSNTERYQLANPGNQPYTVGAPQGGRRGNPSVRVGVSPGSSAAASQEAQRIGIMQSLRNNLAEQPLYAGFSNGGIIGKLKEAITGEKDTTPPPRSTTISIRGRSDDMQVPAFANGGSVRQEPTQSPNANWGKRPQMDETTTRIVNAAGKVVDHPAYAVAQFHPAASIPLGGIAAGVHALQGRTDELPIDVAAMIPGAKGVMLAKGAKLAAQKAIGTTGRVANGVQALSSVDAFGSPAYANGGKIKGPGTPTSDSIAAKVKQTGEPIAVSTGERIVSKAQDVYLQKVASGMGFDSLDAMLEAGTGKPVGPTIKGGMKHAYNGADITPDPIDETVVKKPFQETRDIYRMAKSDTDNANSIGAKIHHATKGTLAMLPAVYSDIASDVGRAVTPVVTPLFTGEDSPAVSQQAQAPTPVKPSQSPTSSTQSAPNVGGPDVAGLAAAEAKLQGSRFIPNAQQIAKPSGAIQGMSSVGATQMTAPNGGGYITNRAGKAMMLEPQAIAAKDPNGQYDANGNNMAYTNQMKEQLAGMQRERLMRDMGADITSQGTRVAAAQQLAQMDKDQGLQLLANRGAREDATAAMDQQLKGQQIAQIADNNALQKKVIEGDPIAMEQWNRIHTKAPDQYINVPDGEEVDANGNVLRRPNRVISARTGQELARQTAQASPAVAVGTPVKAPDGTHTFQGKTITVKDGKVTGVK